MKKLLVGMAVLSLFVGSVLFADVPLNKKHKGMEKDGEKVNCAYCHTKAGNPKEGKNYEKYKTGKFCKGSGCH